ncbi:MAG: penicillin-binding transpeptidase domain-containing protein [Erysipelotrichales bacterium]|nr:penicillin-binding transpeptidase domain-containing protein [Erysipelotrichales bacterium]
MNYQNSFTKKRIISLFIIIMIGIASIVFKLTYIQFIDYNFINQRALDLWARQVPIYGKRGNIYDRNGQLIVGNQLAPSLAVIPRQVQNKNEVAIFLADVLNTTPQTILNHLNRNVSVELIKPSGRKLSMDQVERILAQNIRGLYLVGDSKRFYPHGSTLAQVLGFTGIDNQGIAGIEFIYDDFLSGQDGSLNIFTDARGNLMDGMMGIYQGGTRGLDISLTIDLNMQLIVENVIRQAVARYRPDQMMVLVTNVRTGEVLSMASYPTFDPANYQNYPQEIYNRNLPIWMSFEPGSTFKIMTYAAGLQEGVFGIDDQFFDPGYRIVNGVRINDWKPGGHGLQTFLEVLQNSCNPGFMEIGERLGTERLFRYIRDFGFGQRTGIDLLGESTGIVFNVDNVGPLELATSAFGQGNSVTPIQLAMAANAAVNGGNLMVPHILRNVQVPGINSVVFEQNPVVRRQVISPEVSRVVASSLEHVTARGTGRGAYIEGFRVGGKTGTAQKVGPDGQYLDNNYILSFLGMAPMNNPEISVYLAIDNPRNTIQFGGVVAAPLVGQIFEQILPLAGVQRQTQDQIERELRWLLDTRYFDVANFVGMDISQIIRNPFFHIEVVGRGQRVLGQLPAAGERVREGGRIILYT